MIQPMSPFHTVLIPFVAVALFHTLGQIETNAFVVSPSSMATKGNMLSEFDWGKTSNFRKRDGLIRFMEQQKQEIISPTEEKATLISPTGKKDAKVDMNVYNVDLATAAEQWTAQLVRKNAQREEGISLGVSNATEYMIDTLQMEITRAGGLGLELTEIAGGREDGLGITIVSELVEGGNAENSGILPGDSIVGMQIDRTVTEKDPDTQLLTEVVDTTTVSTECLGSDATFDAILSLPPLETDDEKVLVTIKRIRRRPRLTVLLQYPPSQTDAEATTLTLFAGENLRRALLIRGVKLNDPLAKRFDSGNGGSNCGAEGTCATCAVAVVRGGELLSPPSLKEKQIFKKRPNWRMACRVLVGDGCTEGDLVLQVNPRQWKEPQSQNRY